MKIKLLILTSVFLLLSQLVSAGEPLPPLAGNLARPFTGKEAIASRFWKNASRDLPHFGAARNPPGRQHAGVDLYPEKGAGAPVYAMLDGIVLKVATFYTRRNGERTFGVLVDHGSFVINYGEIRPVRKAGEKVCQGDLLGNVSGTAQLHLEMYSAGTKNWIGGWYGARPQSLLDPTEMMLKLFK